MRLLTFVLRKSSCIFYLKSVEFLNVSCEILIGMRGGRATGCHGRNLSLNISRGNYLRGKNCCTEERLGHQDRLFTSCGSTKNVGLLLPVGIAETWHCTVMVHQNCEYSSSWCSTRVDAQRILAPRTRDYDALLHQKRKLTSYWYFRNDRLRYTDAPEP